MKSCVQYFLLCLVGFPMVAGISCPASDSILDEASRDKILETVNRDRELIRRGELLLTNGQYALQGANMKNLTWDCTVEANIVNKAEAMCNGSYGQYSIHEVPFSSYLQRFGNVGSPIIDHVNYWTSSDDFNASTYLQFAFDTRYRSPSYMQFRAFYLSEVGQTIGCAAHPCPGRNWTQLICKTSPSVAINETIYTPTKVVIPPVPGPVCSVPGTLLTPAHRAKLISSLNEKRAQALNGTLQLYDGKYALQAQSMPLLNWDCELEAKVNTIIEDRCIKIKVSGTFNESSWNEHEKYNTIDYYVHIFSKTDIAGVSLKVLSNSTDGIILSYHMLDQRILHDKATKIGCAIAQCDYQLSGKPSPLTMMVCTFDVNWMPIVNGTRVKIYNSINDATTTVIPSTTTTTTTEVTTTTTTTKAPPTGCTTNYDTTTTPTTTVEPEPAKCPQGYVYFEATISCYGRKPETGLAWNTWPKAEQYCERQGGHLASIHSEEENKLIVSLGKPYGWGVWVGLYSVDENYTWKWSDATPIDYVPWFYGADGPMNLQVNVSCVLASPYYDPRGSLINDLCNNQNYFVCQLPALN